VNQPTPAEVLRRLRPVPTYRGHPATKGRDVVGVDPGGTPRRVHIVGSTDPVLLLFLSSTCLGCRDFWEDAGALPAALPGVRVVVVTHDPGREDPAAIAGLAAAGGGAAGEGTAGADGAAGADVVMSSAAYVDYGVGGPPFFAVTVGSVVRTEGVAWGVSETAEVVRRALAELAAP